jgi:hypothetical protein
VKSGQAGTVPETDIEKWLSIQANIKVADGNTFRLESPERKPGRFSTVPSS